MTRLATIDLGTNTVHLLVAEVTPRARGWRTVLATQRVTRLGEGVSATGALGDLPAARTAAVVVDYVARARAAPTVAPSPPISSAPPASPSA